MIGCMKNVGGFKGLELCDMGLGFSIDVLQVGKHVGRHVVRHVGRHVGKPHASPCGQICVLQHVRRSAC